MRTANEHLYAYLCEGKEKKLICIDDITEEDRKKDFICPACNGKMIPKIGKVRRWHFAHKSVTNCSGESYLHILGKELFKKAFDECSSMWVDNSTKYICPRFDECNIRKTLRFYYVMPCAVKNTIHNRFDLKEYYDKAIIEEHSDKWKADILLKGKKASIPDMLIEIKVTHECEDEKKNSGKKIIEIDISFFDEEYLKSCFERLKEGRENLNVLFPVKFYGLREKPVPENEKRYISTTIGRYGQTLKQAEIVVCNEAKRREELFLVKKEKEIERKIEKMKKRKDSYNTQKKEDIFYLTDYHSQFGDVVLSPKDGRCYRVNKKTGEVWGYDREKGVHFRKNGPI